MATIEVFIGKGPNTTAIRALFQARTLDPVLFNIVDPATVVAGSLVPTVPGSKVWFIDLPAYTQNNPVYFAGHHTNLLTGPTATPTINGEALLTSKYWAVHPSARYDQVVKGQFSIYINTGPYPVKALVQGAASALNSLQVLTIYWTPVP